MSTYSFTLDSEIDVRVKPFPTPKWVQKIEWIKLGDGSYAPRIRPSSGDLHETEITIFGLRDEVEAIQLWIDTHPQVVSLTSINTFLFVPLINHGASLSVFITTNRTEQLKFVGDAQGGYYELRATMRAVSYSITNTVGSLTTLRQRSSFKAGHDFVIAPRWSYKGVPTPANPGTTQGEFDEEFYQDTLEAEAILKFFHVNRGKAFLFPTLPGLTYPYGQLKGSVPGVYCHATDIEVRRANLKYWFIRPSLPEAYR